MSTAVIEAPTRPAPAEPLAPSRVPEVMPISRAMRWGIALTLPAKNEWVALDFHGEPRACALGAALVGWLGLDIGNSYNSGALREVWPELDNVMALCPVPWQGQHALHPEDGSLLYQVIGLNDRGEATREELADWLESLGL